MKTIPPNLTHAADLFAEACRLAREYNLEMSKALDYYGDHGPQVSGAGREHFPTCTKDHLRSLARNCSIMLDAAYAACPPRVRRSTMRKLAAFIAARDGTGFYGPTA